MLTSKARRRLALKTSAMAVLGAGIFGGLPVVAALAAPVDVVYNCGPATAKSPYWFNMELRTPASAVTPNATVTVTWDVKPPTGTPSHSPAATASEQITPTSTIVARGTVSPSGSPMPSTSITASGAATQFTTISPGATMPAVAMTMVIKPTATGTIGLKGGNFELQVNGETWYECEPGASGGPSAHFVVTTGSTGTPTGTGTPTNTGTGTPTPTPTTSTPRPTKTTTEIVTVTPSSERSTKKSQTPKSGADTGAGGMMGPDGRTFILAGTALIGAAALGGLLMRRRNATRG
ncbi:hypothetical protein [Nonomuraea wenchangensis]|uniref:hypothetical protein n=1 Tax=Nonomuraea wenchangensis TaxID=568860 RepID=UPI0034303EF5